MINADVVGCRGDAGDDVITINPAESALLPLPGKAFALLSVNLSLLHKMIIVFNKEIFSDIVLNFYLYDSERCGGGESSEGVVIPRVGTR